MKKFFKEDIFIFITILVIFLIFKNNITFKNTILNGSILFFEQIFPTLFPFFIINDILINYNFYKYTSKIFYKLFKKIFNHSKIATYIFIMSLISGTPTNAYLTTNLVSEKLLSKKDASIIISYANFLNPFFLYTILSNLFNNVIALKIIIINYLVNFIIAFFYKKHPYQDIEVNFSHKLSFFKVLSNSINRCFNTLIIVFGTILFYFILCDSLNLIINSPLINCFLNGILETTGGILKLKNLNISIYFKEILAIIFISFSGLSINTQIKNILDTEDISFKPFFIARLIQVVLSTSIFVIIS